MPYTLRAIDGADETIAELETIVGPRAASAMMNPSLACVLASPR
ncbi:hypothetical protein AB0L42_41195 [Streptomyces sp. NPDC052287]|nr:hypothetical protein [Streptomyces sp. RPA4-2]